MSREVFPFSPAFQDQMLALMLKDISFRHAILTHIPMERLHSDAHKWFFGKIDEMSKKNKDLITMIEIEDDSKFIEKSKRKLYMEFAKRIFSVKIENEQFLKDKMTAQAREYAFVDIFTGAQTHWNLGKKEEAFNITQKGMAELYGINFTNEASIPIQNFIQKRRDFLSASALTMRKIPSGIEPLDAILRGGIEVGEMGILLAEPKKGKSIGLNHFSYQGTISGATVAHFVLEGTTEQALFRFLSRMTLIDYARIESDDLSLEEARFIDATTKKYENKFHIIPFNQHWNYTPQDIDAKIDELANAGMKPQLVVVDYADLLKPANKVSEKRHEQTEVYRDLKRLAVMKKVAIWTACLSGETKIHTLHGHIPIRELEGKKDIPVYAYNHEKGCVEVQTIEKVFQTSEAAEVWELELDNGEKIRMTPNHRLMMRNGEYKKLEDCVIGESLMPLRSYLMKPGTGDRKERYINLNNGKRKRESHLVEEYSNGPLNDLHVHHKDRNPLNNHPLNLMRMTNEEHKRLHMIEDENWMKTEEGKNWWAKNNCQFNHKIVSITKCPILVPTYNMTVSPSHNYALSAGIIVKNSQAKRPEDKPELEYLLRSKDISESFEKVRIADFVATLNQTPKEKDFGIMRLHLDIYRSNDMDRTLKLLTNYEKMIFYNKKYGHSTPNDFHPWMSVKKGRRS